jgi:hypothetical protein
MNENVIPVPARYSASARKREDGNAEGSFFKIVLRIAQFRR